MIYFYISKIELTKKVTIPKVFGFTPFRDGPGILAVSKPRFNAIDFSNIVFVEFHFQASVVVFDSLLVCRFRNDNGASLKGPTK